MTYQEQELLAEGGTPINLYLFQIGAEAYRYTSAEGGYTWGGFTYTHVQVTHGNIQQTSEERRQQLEFTLPASDPVCSRFIGIVPGQLMTVSITQVHEDDPDQEGRVYWRGRITGAAFSKNGIQCSLQALTQAAAVSHTLPRRRYQGMCNHALYDGRCQVDRSSFVFTGAVSSVSGSTLVVTGLAAMGDGWATGGYVSLGSNDWRLVMAHTGNTLTMMLPFKEDAAGATVSVYAGCDHSLSVCESKFSNADNFGGFPYVPLRNPFTQGID